MKMSKLAIECMCDSYQDRIVSKYEDAKRTGLYPFPALLAKESKAIFEEVAWMEEGSWISGDEAGKIWSAVEEITETLLKDWEAEMAKE